MTRTRALGLVGFGLSIPLLPEQPLDLQEKHGHLRVDRLPHQLVVEKVVAVDQAVAERDDPPMLADAKSGFGLYPGYPSDGLADDLQVALYGLAEKPVAPVVVEVPPPPRPR